MSRVLTFREVSKRFQDKVTGSDILAVDQVSLEVQSSEFVSIIGPSGCGKSTLLNIAAGLEKLSQGMVLVDNEPCSAGPAHFGYMFQRDLLFPWRTAVANVAIPLEVAGVPKVQAMDRARKLIERFALAQFSDSFPTQLSGGMRQRVAFMRTIIGSKEILLLDEPFGALDSITRSEMQQWLLDVWQQDRRTVLLVTHDIDEAIYLSDRVLLMSRRPGRIIEEYRVDIPRPRDKNTNTTEKFIKIKKAIQIELARVH